MFLERAFTLQKLVGFRPAFNKKQTLNVGFVVCFATSDNTGFACSVNQSRYMEHISIKCTLKLLRQFCTNTREVIKGNHGPTTWGNSLQIHSVLLLLVGSCENMPFCLPKPSQPFLFTQTFVNHFVYPNLPNHIIYPNPLYNHFWGVKK